MTKKELHYEDLGVSLSELYEQMGYEVCGEAVDGDTFRCIRMEKDL